MEIDSYHGSGAYQDLVKCDPYLQASGLKTCTVDRTTQDHTHLGDSSVPWGEERENEDGERDRLRRKREERKYGNCQVHGPSVSFQTSLL